MRCQNNYSIPKLNNIVFYISYKQSYNIYFKSETVLNLKCTLIGNVWTFLSSVPYKSPSCVAGNLSFSCRPHVHSIHYLIYVRRHTGRVIRSGSLEAVFSVVGLKFNSEHWEHLRSTIMAITMTNTSSHSKIVSR